MGKKTNMNSRKDMKERTNRKGSTNKKGSAQDRDEYGRRKLDDPYAKNDISWYVPNEQMLRDCASLSFANVLARPISLTARDDGEPFTYEIPNPGVMTLDYVPSLGVLYGSNAPEIQGTDSINAAAQSIYSFIRHANSGSANYQAADLMMYLLAMGNIYTAWSYLVRLYGVARTYNYYNKYYPQAIIKAMGIEHPEIVPEILSDLRSYINVKAIQMSSFAVPTVMPLFSRWLWLSQNIFLDSQSAKSQTYLPLQVVHYKFNEAGQNGPQLDPVQLPTFASATADGLMSDLREWFDSLWNGIYNNESIGIMSGDILKVYGGGNIYQFSTISEDYTILPIWVDKILPQIHNASIAPMVASDFQPIKQDPVTGWIYQRASLGDNFQSELLLNVRDGETDPTSVMYATRLMHAYDKDYDMLYSGSEIVISAGIWKDASDLSQYEELTSTVKRYVNSDTDAQFENARRELRLATALTKFDWAPHHSVIFSPTASSAPFVVANWTDTDMFTTIETSTLKKIQTCAISGEFGIPASLLKA